MSEQPRDSVQWTCEHGVVGARGCNEYGCESGFGAIQDRWAFNRADTERRYREHLRLGPTVCGCGYCCRKRAMP